MEYRMLGNTGLEVSRLGAGLAEIGSGLTLGEEKRASEILNLALDSGINFLDTAACYGISEQLIGRTVAHRRDEYILASKAGHATGDYEGRPWTAETVRHSIERSLRRLKTDHLDLIQLHSCSVEILERGEVIEALVDAKQAGLTRFIGYSGDNEAARWAVEHEIFDTLQTSFNLVDQKARKELFAPARERGMGLIAKRPIANAAWGRESSPSFYANVYHRRAQTMAGMGPIAGDPGNPIVLALGFVLAHEAVDTAIVGTSDKDHMEANIRWVEADLPIDEQSVAELEERFDEVGQGWSQET